MQLPDRNTQTNRESTDRSRYTTELSLLTGETVSPEPTVWRYTERRSGPDAGMWIGTRVDGRECTEDRDDRETRHADRYGQES